MATGDALSAIRVRIEHYVRAFGLCSPSVGVPPPHPSAFSSLCSHLTHIEKKSATNQIVTATCLSAHKYSTMRQRGDEDCKIIAIRVFLYAKVVMKFENEVFHHYLISECLFIGNGILISKHT